MQVKCFVRLFVEVPDDISAEDYENAIDDQLSQVIECDYEILNYSPIDPTNSQS